MPSERSVRLTVSSASAFSGVARAWDLSHLSLVSVVSLVSRPSVWRGAAIVSNYQRWLVSCLLSDNSLVKSSRPLGTSSGLTGAPHGGPAGRSPGPAQARVAPRTPLSLLACTAPTMGQRTPSHSSSQLLVYGRTPLPSLTYVRYRRSSVIALFLQAALRHRAQHTSRVAMSFSVSLSCHLSLDGPQSCTCRSPLFSCAAMC